MIRSSHEDEKTFETENTEAHVMASPKKMTRQQWFAVTEARTIKRQPDGLRKAKRAFNNDLSLAQQMALVKELVETRGAELCRAYKNVIDVCYGYGEKTDKKTGKSRQRPRPCVIFVVKKKWRANDTGDADERLPKYLFTYWTVRKKRVLCVVETDVEDGGKIAALRPQASVEKIKVCSNGTNATGLIAAKVECSNKPGKTFFMSCRHVLSISRAMLPPASTRNLSIFVGRDSAPFARTDSAKGQLTPQAKYSFDAQLAEVLDRDRLDKVLNGLNLVGFAKTMDDIPKRYWIIRANGPTLAEFHSYKYGLSIDYPNVGSVVHRQVIQSTVNGSTAKGDSGAPIVVGKHGGRFLGMHIAGVGSTSIMIPAWQLMTPSLYLRTAGETWKLL